MAELLLGLDIGTSSCKGALVSLSGEAVAEGQYGYRTDYPRPGWAEQRPEDWWTAVCRVTRGLLDGTGYTALDIAAVGVDGQSWAMAALDGRGEALLPSPLWTDTRAAAECEALQKSLPALPELCGNPLVPGYTSPKVLWLKKHAPELYGKTEIVLQSNGYIVYRLTGAYSQDLSQAYGWHCFSNRDLRWDETAAEAMGIDRRLLPPLYACHQTVGRVTDEAAARTGLLAGTPVVAGGLDAAAGTLGVGVTEAGETQEQAGQAGGMSICLTHYAAHPRLILSPHVVPGRWLLQGGTTGGSGAFRWFREQCCPELTYEEMDALAECSEPLSGGLVFLPYMAGERSPLWMPEAKGVFYGLSFAATRGDMLRAVMEGTAYALRHNLDTAWEAGCAVTELRASGGGAASPLWMTIKANVTGCAMSAVRAERATVRGAAMLAGVGVGAVPGWNAWKRPASGRRFEPDPALRKRYECGYERYRALIEAMIPVYMEGRNQT